MDKPIIHSVFLTIHDKLNDYVSSTFDVFMTTFGTFGRAFVALYVVSVGIMIMKGKGGEKTKELLASAILLPLLWGVVGESHIYFNWVINPLDDTIFALCDFFISVVQNGSSSGATGIEGLFNNLDSLAYKLYDFLFKIDLEGDLLDDFFNLVKGITLILVLIVIFTASYLAFAVQMILCFFSLYVMFLVGGICIFFAAFKETRFIFNNWLKAITKHSLTMVFASIVMSICYFGIYDSLEKLQLLTGESSLYSPQYVVAVCWSLLTFCTLKMTSEYAADIGGGMAGSTAGIGAAVGMAGGAAAGVMGLKASQTKNGRGAIQGGAKAAGKGAKGLGNMAKSAYRSFSARKGIS